MEDEHRQKLEEVAAMSTSDARDELLRRVEKEAQQDLARVMREIENRAKETAEQEARKLVALAIQRVASDQVAEMVVTSVPLPGDEMKGRIIGRNGRNIRDFEQAAARIEKLIKDAEDEVVRDIKEAGEEAAYEANVHGLHPEIIKMLGRLKYRTSYGQNQLQHAVEAAKIASILAAELHADVDTAKMGALLHDLGKAMDHDQEGTHARLGA
jgi:ribonuclease Y